MKAKKHLGQNFLRSEKIVETIVDTGNPKFGELILEIGPGEGIMTTKILKVGANVLAIEADKDLIPILENKFKEELLNGKLKLMYGDVLNSFDLEKEIKEVKYKIIANIPYYITGQIIRKFLSAKNKPGSMTLLVQKEVAERIIAKNKKESLLSISVKIFGEPKYIKTVSKAFFSPQPKVDSAILHIDKISNTRLNDNNEKSFFDLLHLGFGHKRKQLVSNLSQTYERRDIINALNSLGLNDKIRAEDLSMEDWVHLYNIIDR